ncbi:MAG: hypothetical protein ACLFQ5_13110 [Oceanicaulis sp.]
MNDTAERAPRCYFGFRSPNSRLGLHKLARAGFDGEPIAFTRPPDDAVGFADPAANTDKLEYCIHDVARMTRRMRLPITIPDPFDVDFAPANRAFQAAKSRTFRAAEIGEPQPARRWRAPGKKTAQICNFIGLSSELSRISRFAPASVRQLQRSKPRLRAPPALRYTLAGLNSPSSA